MIKAAWRDGRRALTMARMSVLRPSWFFVLALTACGTEHYREALPREDFVVRYEADDTHPADTTVESLDGRSVALASGVVLRSEHVEHVQLLEAADDGQVLVLVLTEAGRARLAEAGETARPLAVIAGGRVVLRATVRGPLVEGEIRISLPTGRATASYRALTR